MILTPREKEIFNLLHDKKEVENIVKEVVGEKPVDVSAIEVYKDAISITTTELSDEQKNQIVAKINEKYATDLVAEDITIEENSHIRGRDILKPYIPNTNLRGVD